MTTNVGPILILSEQPVIAALVGMLVELAGTTAVFANLGEQPADTVRRVRPVALILIDVELDAARSDLFFALASRKRINVAVFGSDGRAREVAEVAAQRRIAWLTLPPDVGRLQSLLGVSNASKQDGRQQQRRQSAEATTAADGTRILRDATGRHWIVYDRRGSGDRRATSRGEITDRVFVAEDGETRCYEIGDGDTTESGVSTLEEQLSRAT